MAKYSPLFDIAPDAGELLVASFDIARGAIYAPATPANLPLWYLLRSFEGPQGGPERQVAEISYILYPGMSGDVPADLWGTLQTPNKWGYKCGGLAKPANAHVVIGKNLSRGGVVSFDSSGWARAPIDLLGLNQDDEQNQRRNGVPFLSTCPFPEGDLLDPTRNRELHKSHSFRNEVVRFKGNDTLDVCIVFSAELAASWTVEDIQGQGEIIIHSREVTPTQ